MHKSIIGLMLVLSSFTAVHAQTNGLGNLVAAEQAIQAEMADKIRLINAEKARKARTAKANGIAKAKRAAVSKAHRNAIASNKAAVAETERLQDRELEILIKRAEAEAKIAALKAKISLADANAKADLNAKVQRREATTDMIRANNDAKRLLAEGSKALLILEGESRVVDAGNQPATVENNKLVVINKQ
ncbi:MAG: DUF5384 family protein [Pseudomonadales bacterium]|nr:DUF5384 family protein [Pseudomonadales bacterium]NRA14781.1 DUF5384 family protein [Oceanospirillaceae bacterium]